MMMSGRAGRAQRTRVTGGGVRVESGRTGAVRADRGRSGPVWTGLGRFGPVWAGLDRSGPVWTGQGRSGPVKAEWAGSGPSGPVQADWAGSGPAGRPRRSGPVVTGPVWTGLDWVRRGAVWASLTQPGASWLARSGSGRPRSGPSEEIGWTGSGE